MTGSVLVACLVAQDEPWLQRFLDRLSALEGSHIRHAFVEGTRVPRLHQWARPDTWIQQESAPPIADRFERLAYLRNLVVGQPIPEDYVLWIDCDVIEFPTNLVTALMRHNVSVVAPSVYINGTKQFYDTFAFRYLNGDHFPPFNLPPAGLLEVNSVGTCYLAHSSLYNQYNVRYRGGDSEQVTFCREVRNVGCRVYVDFGIKAEHAHLPKYGGNWH